MPKVDAPIVDAEIDTSDPVESGKSILYAVGGVGLMVMVLNYGQQVGSYLTQRVDSLTGQNASGSNIGFRGEL
jgi:hypothetical protein